MRAQLRGAELLEELGAERLEELRLELQRKQQATTERARLRRELEAISGTSTAGLVRPRPQLPRNAYAVSRYGTWAMIVARYPGCCRQCGKKTHRNERIAWNVETRETRCTACLHRSPFSLTAYGQRRTQGHRAHQRDRKQRAQSGEGRRAA